MVDHSRAGIYSSAIEKDVAPARLKGFFEKRDSSYQISRRVRDICTFARQNVITDPPFSRLDVISCRNVLIYLSPQVHKRCIPQFHHALNPSGYLVLGSAESIGTFDELFDLVDKKNKIYGKKWSPHPSRPTWSDMRDRFSGQPRDQCRSTQPHLPRNCCKQPIASCLARSRRPLSSLITHARATVPWQH